MSTDAPALSAYWRTINPAHAVQRAAAIISFSENLTSVVVKRIVNAVREEAVRIGLTKEEPINTMLFTVRPGAAPAASSEAAVGCSFQKVQGENVIVALTVLGDAIRFETHAYTRWVAFQEQFSALAKIALPIAEQATGVSSVGLEYVDFFFGAEPGNQDAMQIIDKQSDYIAKKGFMRRAPFHCNTGWFDPESGSTQRLINVDISAADAQGPVGLRRAITIRTFESLAVTNGDDPMAPKLTNPETVISELETIHRSLKKRLRGILTRDAAAMISLGN